MHAYIHTHAHMRTCTHIEKDIAEILTRFGNDSQCVSDAAGAMELLSPTSKEVSLCMYVCVCVCIYIYIHTYINTYINIYIYISNKTMSTETFTCALACMSHTNKHSCSFYLTLQRAKALFQRAVCKHILCAHSHTTNTQHIYMRTCMHVSYKQTVTFFLFDIAASKSAFSKGFSARSN